MAERAKIAILFSWLMIAVCCQQAPVRQDIVGLRVEVNYPAGLNLDQLRFTILHRRAVYGEPVARPQPPRPLDADGEQLVFVFPDEMAGETVTARVDGLAAGQVKASGAGEKRLQANSLQVLRVTLGDAAVCGDQELARPLEECDDGDTEPADGCSGLCLVEEGWHCDQSSPTTCWRCGDGTCQVSEDLCNCPDDCHAASCGDGSCCLRGGENSCTCPADCQSGICGDGLCCVAAGENTCSCQLDCGQEICGNGSCCRDLGETASNCQPDCAFGCGDGACLNGEDPCSCPADCGESACEDGICCSGRGEDRCTCPEDCGAGSCGDGICCTAKDENTCVCPADCGESACQDGTCCAAAGENRCSCPADCGTGFCGDSLCCASTGEDETSCSQDCQAVCPNGRCTTGEDVCSCPADCAGATCGDGSCCDLGRENSCTCPPDCGASSCGDGICCRERGENPCTCQDDCGPSACGDGICCAAWGEDRCTCEADCGGGSCGDNVCCAARGESTCTCEHDCGAPVCGDGDCCPLASENGCACPQDCPGGSTCGDGICCARTNESVCNCAADCGNSICGDATCCRNLGENECSCPNDCGAGSCGDHTCCAEANENASSCPQDCTCPNGNCEAGEDICNCPADCAGATCNDGHCCTSGGEDSCSCPNDCGLSICGDNLCCAATSEDTCTCPQDCPGGRCGDGVCCASTGEDECNCPGDCPGGNCGDGICCQNTGENTCNCPGDCPGGGCGDGICCAATGENSVTCAADCGTCPNVARGLWLSTTGDVTSSGVPGLSAWSAGDALALTGPGLTFEPGDTAGTLTVAFSLDGFAADGNADLDGLHLVSRDFTLGTTGVTTPLAAGNLLFSTAAAETLSGLAVTDNDVVLFRPAVPGDFSTGSFSILLDGTAFVDTHLVAFTLVEQDTQLPDYTVPVGTLLFTQSGTNQSKNLYQYVVTSTGKGTTAGSRSILLALQNLGVPNKQPLVALDLLEECSVLGDETLQAGRLLVAIPVAATFSGIGLVLPQDAFLFRIISTQAGSNYSSAEAAPMLQGADLNLDAAEEALDGLTVLP